MKLQDHHLYNGMYTFLNGGCRVSSWTDPALIRSQSSHNESRRDWRVLTHDSSDSTVFHSYLQTVAIEVIQAWTADVREEKD